MGIDAGSNAFAWRLMGIVFGAILVAIIYLFAATLFSRRRIAVLAALFVTFDAMSYVDEPDRDERHLRRGLHRRRVPGLLADLVGPMGRSAWWALPLSGVLIGLAAATKWVGWYALTGLLGAGPGAVALGRFLLVAAIGFLTIVTGFGAPWPFLVVCLAALLLAVAATWRTPIRPRRRT